MSATRQSKPRRRPSAVRTVATPRPVKEEQNLAYTIGRIGFDFGTTAIRDSFALIGLKDPDNPRSMLGYLRQIYGPFAKKERLEALLNEDCPEDFQVDVEFDPSDKWPMSPFLKLKREPQPGEPEEERVVMAMAAEPPWGLFPDDDRKIQRQKKLFHHIEGRRHLLSTLMYSTPAAERLIWTLKQERMRPVATTGRRAVQPIEGAPVYAICPQGPFARETYDALIQYLLDQEYFNVERVSIPGRIVGETTLLNKQVVPVIEPQIQGMFSWKPLEPKQSAERSWKQVFDRLSSELRNPGRTPKDRALNFGATTAFMFDQIFEVVKEGQQLYSIDVQQSQGCRAESDCWNVVLSFFNPDNLDMRHQLFEFTFDVSDVIPVHIGTFKTWRSGCPGLGGSTKGGERAEVESVASSNA